MTKNTGKSIDFFEEMTHSGSTSCTRIVENITILSFQNAKLTIEHLAAF